MSKSDVARQIAKTLPGPAKLALWLYVHARLTFSRDTEAADHWLALELATALGYRIPVTARLGNGMKVRVVWNDFIGRTIQRQGYYEPEMVRLFEKLLKPGMILLDIGAHIGQYTLVASQLVGESGAVHSFEPDPETFKWLSANLRLNQRKNVHLNQLALSDAPGKTTFYLSTPDDIGCNSLAKPANYSGREVEVTTTTVDSYLEQQRVPRVDLLKADIEGAEYAMLSGACSLLSSDHKPIIIMEFEEASQRKLKSSCAKLADFLSSHGYALYKIAEDGFESYTPKENDAPSFNILAIPVNRSGLLLELHKAA
jgi:FkbM family methyltransferase